MRFFATFVACAIALASVAFAAPVHATYVRPPQARAPTAPDTSADRSASSIKREAAALDARGAPFGFGAGTSHVVEKEKGDGALEVRGKAPFGFGAETSHVVEKGDGALEGRGKAPFGFGAETSH
jgi:hypothetical protein